MRGKAPFTLLLTSLEVALNSERFDGLLCRRMIIPFSLNQFNRPASAWREKKKGTGIIPPLCQAHLVLKWVGAYVIYLTPISSGV